MQGQKQQAIQHRLQKDKQTWATARKIIPKQNNTGEITNTSMERLGPFNFDICTSNPRTNNITRTETRKLCTTLSSNNNK